MKPPALAGGAVTCSHCENYVSGKKNKEINGTITQLCAKKYPTSYNKAKCERFKLYHLFFCHKKNQRLSNEECLHNQAIKRCKCQEGEILKNYLKKEYKS